MLSVTKQSSWVLVACIAILTSQAFGHGMSEAEKQIIIEGGNLRYIWIGATHMLSGYDHLAFVFGIIFFLTKFKDVIKYITAFTIGHSITLIIATFNTIQINYFLIDAVIALSVCYIAFHNLDGFKKHLNIKAPHMLTMIFSLGLTHGLGLSTRLQQLPLNIDQLFMNIISFNIGIELGQIFALAFMLLLISRLRKSHFFPTFSKISNYFLMLAGVFLFLIQMHGYEHAVNANELQVNVSPEQSSIRLKQASSSNWTDTITVTIPARDDKEYKLHLTKGATLNYAWRTNKGDLFFDFHGEPKGDTTGYFKSFKKDTKTSETGSLTAIFEGTHGWYWKNNHEFPIIITLHVSGEYHRLDLKDDSKNRQPTPLIKPAHDTID